MSTLENYLQDLLAARVAGAVPETSGYGALANLLNDVGDSLKPKVRCILNPKNRGSGIPDGGLYTPDQFDRKTDGILLTGQLPSRGVIEVKPTNADVRSIAAGEQVRRYLEEYRRVLVTNYREFIVVGFDAEGQPAELESYSLAPSEAEFWSAPLHPRVTAGVHAGPLAEYLKRVMLSTAPLASPQDVAWVLASYARDARARIEGLDLPALEAVRGALEESLGVKFEGEKGEHFFHSTLVQTLFYGMFSAWVLWSRKHPLEESSVRFEWTQAAWSLRVPVIRALFEQVATPGKLEPLRLVEVLDWAAAALNRVDRRTFFSRFQESRAVQYFYEPFLEAFDPQLRKQLGVWYTPTEVVKYMVARVDRVLREELDVPDGLADPRVYVLDPCCGTGTYLLEVLARIGETLKEKGADALAAHDIKQAALERVFGFEIMPAPFVISHLQIGLFLEHQGAPFLERDGERASVFLTNALTGWEKEDISQHPLPFPELQQEHDAAAKVKRELPILVILGNPPYNGFAGMAVSEERALCDAYREVKRVPRPQGQGLNDLYVRFFRMAERRIVDGTGRGIVCLISNYSWLDGLSFTGMRERYLEAFDKIWIDCLNGDAFKTGKLTPDGSPDPSIFSTEDNRTGIQLGTAIALLSRASSGGCEDIQFRHFWGQNKRQELVGCLEAERPYMEVEPQPELGLPFFPSSASEGYFGWPLLIDLMPVCSPGVKTSRDADLADIELDRLKRRIALYFDSSLSDAQAAAELPCLMDSAAGFDAVSTRHYLQTRGTESGEFLAYAYRPFDTRWVYWHPLSKLLDRKRPELRRDLTAGNLFLTSRQKAERSVEGTPFLVTRALPDWHLTRPGSMCLPVMSVGSSQTSAGEVDGGLAGPWVANLSDRAREYLRFLGSEAKESDLALPTNPIWFHALAIGSAQAYLSENADGLRLDWPRVPLPDSRESLDVSAVLGHKVADLLDPETSVLGVTAGPIRPELRTVAAPARVDGGSLDSGRGDLAVTVSWGHAGQGDVVMPGKGRAVSRDYNPEEIAAISAGAEALGFSLDQIMHHLGETTFDIYLNDVAFWRNVPANVWSYTIGGYQVVKKWLSYREKALLGRDMKAEEVREVTAMARRIAAILLLQPALNANYNAAKASTWEWASK